MTSATAIANILSNEVYRVYDSAHTVGGRVDIIAHSMGGLAARNYAGLPNYQSDPRSRNLGAIHDLITIDTPVQGSGLGGYMLSLATLHPLQNSYGGIIPAHVLAAAHCAYTQTGQECFNTMGLSLASPAVYPSTGQPFSPETGAVYSLQPNVINQQTSPIKPVDSTWTAISVQFSESGTPNSALRYIVQNLMYNFYDASQTPPTLTATIGDPSGTNDVIVGTNSQTAGNGGVMPDFESPMSGRLEHTATPGIQGYIGFIPAVTDDDVLHSSDGYNAILAALRQ